VTRLRWGILGTARINRLIIPALRASPRSVVHAVASREGERARAYAREWDIPHVYASYPSLIESDVDVVYIPLPNSLHVPWTVHALREGKHVLCEKPLALSAPDVDRVSAEAAAANRIVAEGFMYRHHAQTRRLSELIAEGALGQVTVMTAVFTYMQSRDPDVRLDPALGGGALWDVGCYPVSLFNFLAGAAPATAAAVQHVGPTGIDEHFAGILTYESGIVAQFQVGFHSAYHTSATILGTGGALEVARPYRPGVHERLILRRTDDTIDTIDVTGRPIFHDQIADFEDAVLGHQPPRIPLEDSRRLALTLTALRQAARDGVVVSVAG
jgi:predicted dehydrogenase